MDFSINFTLIVQMLHFFVAYFLLKRFLFRSAIDLLVERENQEIVLTSQIEDQELELSKRKQDITALWVGAKNKFVKDLSGIYAKKIATVKVPELKVEVLSESERLLEEGSLKNHIVDRIRNG